MTRLLTALIYLAIAAVVVACVMGFVGTFG